MPELCRLNGLIIVMYYKDTSQHNKPHVHAQYGEYKATVSLEGELLAGKLPRKQFKILVGWLLLHDEELYAAWNSAVIGKPFNKIKGYEQ